MLKISKYYELWTEEDLEQGEPAGHGEVFSDVEYTFRELVSELKKFNEKSSTDINRFTWAIKSSQNFRTGDIEDNTLHFSRNNIARHEKYWIKALKVAKL